MGDAPTPPPEGATESLDIAIDWLRQSIDQLAEAQRRTQELGASVAVRPAQVARPAAGPAQPAPSPAPPAPSPAPPSTTTPLLDRVGRDLTKLATEGTLAPLIGRDEEMTWLIETLVRSAKRNPVLLGPAGAGKTAIVEGLAQRIVAGRVPPQLRGVRLIEVPLGGLVAGTEYRGQLEERLQQLVSEASQPGIILFFDEIHLLEGAGRSEGGMGADEVLKPALARGEIAVIGATTSEAWRATIERDTALARRFTTISIAELDKAASRPILRSVRDRLATARGVRVSDQALDVLLDFAESSILNRRFPDKAIDLLEQAVARAIVAGRTKVDRADAIRTTEEWAERLAAAPTLSRLGRDLVALARDGNLGPIVGREREIDTIVEILLRHTKRNPLLLGPAGSGKTAIVEGLAIRVAAGNVPPALHGMRLFDVPILPLAQAIANEPDTLADFLLEARHPSVVLFLDEIHQLGTPAARDLGEALKPPLARGEIACIGATTGEEYQATLESETALARRFSVIAIQPMDEAGVRQVLVAVRDNLARLRGVRVEDDAIDDLVVLADRYLPNRSFPDKGVDLIEQSVAYALRRGLTTVDTATARAAVTELVGMPLDPAASLATLATHLRAAALMDDAAASALVARLGVTLRGLDSRSRPSAVALAWGRAASGADVLASTLARDVFGEATRVIAIDLGGMTEDQSISSLLGSAPGLVGSDRALPLQELRRTPWEVVLFRGIDRCASSIRDVIANGLAAGFLTDAMGRTLPLRSAVVIATAPELDPPAAKPEDAAALLRAALGPALLDACDVLVGPVSASPSGARTTWVRDALLAPLADRFARQGIHVAFDPTFVAWVEHHLPADVSAASDFIDRTVTPALVASMPAADGDLTATIVNDQPVLVIPETST